MIDQVLNSSLAKLDLIKTKLAKDINIYSKTNLNENELKAVKLAFDEFLRKVEAKLEQTEKDMLKEEEVLSYLKDNKTLALELKTILEQEYKNIDTKNFKFYQEFLLNMKQENHLKL